ncbi:hypothetical protein [Cytobacillus horneckiae]|uniref:hypothetical protein n=1 Tax=Cytobacillus horneckiae TaxID=549687 RepID=UPI003D23FF78
MSESLKGFFECWDGEMVLSDIRNFKDEADFIQRAQDYVSETRGQKIPLSEPTLSVIKINDEEWANVDVAEFEGEVITVFVSDIEWEKGKEVN